MNGTGLDALFGEDGAPGGALALCSSSKWSASHETPRAGEKDARSCATERTPRSSHKVVTPLRKHAGLFVVESLESLFSDARGVTEHISRLTVSAASMLPVDAIHHSPRSRLAAVLSASCPSLGTLVDDDPHDNDRLLDPSLLQSHIQRSFEGIGLDSATQTPRRLGRDATASHSQVNSLHGTPMQKQSRSQELLSVSGRLQLRRSSLVSSTSAAALTDGRECIHQCPDGDLSSLPSLADNHHHSELDVSGAGLGGLMEATWNTSIESCLIANVEAQMNEDGDEGAEDDDEEEEEEGPGPDGLGLDSANDDDVGDSETDSDASVYEGERGAGRGSVKRQLRPTQLPRDTPRNLQLPPMTDYRDGSKPPYSYASLIAQAILASPRQRLALSSIYNWITTTYPYYQGQSCGWQNSIRHNLSLNRSFRKMPRDDDEPGKGAYWTVDFETMDDFEDGMFKRRRSVGGNGNGHKSCKTSLADTPRDRSRCQDRLLLPVAGTGTALPMTPGTCLKTPLVAKVAPMTVHVTPKIAASCPDTWSRSPFSSVFRHPAAKDANLARDVNRRLFAASEERVNEIASAGRRTDANSETLSLIAVDSPATKILVPDCDEGMSSAAFWSYPNLPLTQLGLDADPPSPDGEAFSVEQFLQDHSMSATGEDGATPLLFAGIKPHDGMSTTLSPLSWLLAVSAEDGAKAAERNILDSCLHLYSEPQTPRTFSL